MVPERITFWNAQPEINADVGCLLETVDLPCGPLEEEF
jgi:hypothetical protein